MTDHSDKSRMRRRAMQAGMIGGLALFNPASVAAGTANTAGRPKPCNVHAIDDLIAALRSTRNAACIKMARRLQALPVSATHFDLHLRRSALSADNAFVIAHALALASNTDCVDLRSFSVSYNTDLNDASVVALVSAFPASVAEIGLVGCNIGDDAGIALVQWARKAPRLQMVCVEKNRFSADVRAMFGALARARPDLLVTV